MLFKNSINANPDIVSDELIHNKLFVHPSWESIPFNDNIDWKQDPFKNRTWCFYLHSLTPINYLITAYEKNHKIEYIKKATDIISSWLEANDSLDLEPSEYAWKDHSSANRVVALIFFWNSYKKSEIFNKKFEHRLFKSLQRHGSFLFDDKNYNHRNNHGAYQDRSLLELAVIFPEWDKNHLWFNKAKERLMIYLQRFVSPLGIHKEHSASYHILMLKMLWDIDKFLIYHNHRVPELSDIVYNMEDYLAYIVKPDGKVPMTGDSGPDAVKFLKQDDIKNPHLLYVRTEGKKGIKPANEIVYKKDGIGIFRGECENKNPMYFKFLSAFHSLAHKHADDLSFLLSIGKTDFFVDSGKYNYQEKDEYRKYFRSSMAHNGITVNRKSYELRSNQSGKSKIKKYEIKNDYSYITAIHTLYPSVKINRTIIYLKKCSSILIHDQIESSTQRTYSQIFNIGKNVIIDPLSKKKIILSSTIESKSIELLQINHVTEFKNYKGETNPIAGWQSTSFNEKHPIHQLQFSNKGNDMEYKTIINLNSKKGIKYFSLKNMQEIKMYSVIFKDNNRYSFKIK